MYVYIYMYINIVEPKKIQKSQEFIVKSIFFVVLLYILLVNVGKR